MLGGCFISVLYHRFGYSSVTLVYITVPFKSDNVYFHLKSELRMHLSQGTDLSRSFNSLLELFRACLNFDHHSWTSIPSSIWFAEVNLSCSTWQTHWLLVFLFPWWVLVGVWLRGTFILWTSESTIGNTMSTVLYIAAESLTLCLFTYAWWVMSEMCISWRFLSFGK